MPFSASNAGAPEFTRVQRAIFVVGGYGSDVGVPCLLLAALRAFCWLRSIHLLELFVHFAARIALAIIIRHDGVPPRFLG